MAVGSRTKRNYSYTKAKASTDFLGGVSVSSWSVEGSGAGGFLIARLPDTITGNNPVPGVTRITENYRLIPFLDIYQAYFSSIPGAQFSRMSVSFTTTDIVTSLNIEEP